MNVEFPASTTSGTLQSLGSLRAPIELAVVIPTFNERENALPLISALKTALVGIEWEAVFVDDNSPDGTADHIREIAAIDFRIRILERIGRRGLSSACIEGMLSTPARFIAVIDGDLQHDERALPQMLERMKAEGLDIVVGSREDTAQGRDASSRWRVFLTNLGARLSRLVFRREVSDPMSGFFLLDRNYFQHVVYRLTGTGFKILVDLLASSDKPVRIGEVFYSFRTRCRGISKLDANAEMEYVYLLIDKIVGKSIPTRFALFVFVGSLGLLLHLSALAVLYRGVQMRFMTAQVWSTIAAMTFNFLLNNMVTFRDRRLRGWRFATGLLTFYLACSLGALINLGFAELLLGSGIPWYFAGIAGMAVSSVWNYGVNTVLTWRHNQARA